MRRELLLGGLVSAGFHLVLFLAPWTLLPKNRILWSPKPELEISLPSLLLKEEPSKQEPSVAKPASFQEEYKPIQASQENLEPPALKKEKEASTQTFSKPKVKPRSEAKKQEAQSRSSLKKEEDIAKGLESADSAFAPEIAKNASQEVGSAAGKGEKTQTAGSNSGAGELPKPQLKKAIPRYERNPKPAYPEAARRRGYQGTVILLVLVLRDGSPGWVQIAKGSGYTLLDEAAKEAVARWRFVPALLGEEPVEMEVEVPILFKLE